MDGISVSLGRRLQNLAEVISGPDIKIVRSENFTTTVYRGELRTGVVGEAFDFLREGVRVNKYFDDNEAGEISSQDGNVIVGEDIFAPARFGRPVNLRQMENPFSQFFPIFFPNCRGDVDDPREIEISEADWIIHMIRLVKKNLVEFPLFVFAAAFRVDTAKIVGAYFNAVCYTRSGEGVIEKCEGFHFRQTLRASAEYYTKVQVDIEAKIKCLGNPQFFFTFSNNSRWEITLATALSQERFDVWHKRDEANLLALMEGFDEPEDTQEKYFVHIQEGDPRFAGNIPRCMYHRVCRRVPMSTLLEEVNVNQLLARNSYNIQRVFEQRVREVVNAILLSSNNGVGVRLYHIVKEFTLGCPSGHVHGVGWRGHDGMEAIFRKLHDTHAVTNAEKEQIVRLADSIISTSLSAGRLCHDFEQLSQESAARIVDLAARHQQHVCGDACEIEDDSDGCSKHFPRLPTDITILSSPPSGNAGTLIGECAQVKENVRRVLSDLQAHGRLGVEPLVNVLQLALGDPTEFCDDEGISWSHGRRQFPLSETLQSWKTKLRSEGSDHVLPLAMYYTALSTSTWSFDGELLYQLLPKRRVEESFTVDYNPFLLEAMESNMELSLITYTPHRVVEYITKEKHRAFSLNKASKKLMRRWDDVSLGNILEVINEDRNLSLPEAFYRVDRSLSLSATNMPVIHVDADLPHQRKRFFQKCRDGPDVLPGSLGRFREIPDLFDDYIANRYKLSKLTSYYFFTQPPIYPPSVPVDSKLQLSQASSSSCS